MAKTAYKRIVYGLHGVLSKGLPGHIQGGLIIGHMSSVRLRADVWWIQRGLALRRIAAGGHGNVTSLLRHVFVVFARGPTACLGNPQ